jgi:hypothetical protein
MSEVDDGEELEHLYAVYGAAVRYAGRVLTQKGMMSTEFIEADKASAVFYRRIREILDKTEHFDQTLTTSGTTRLR